jgi:threonine aldolase
MIDLRSDTVTRPTPAMLKAMSEAKVGDDVFGEDPTVIELEQKCAKMFGQEAGLFCPSGTMTNQIAIKVHTQPGDEIICDVTSHIYQYEGGGMAFNSGVQPKLVHAANGQLSAADVEACINPNADWLTRSRLVCIENTGNKSGGGFYSLQRMKEIGAVCRKYNMAYHLDGARVFNAIVEADYSTEEMGKLFDSISICLSKGLGAPAGSVLVGNADFIKKARRIRKIFGGGMRQAGFIAAAGIYALDNHVTRLKEDHRKAKILAEALKKVTVVESILPVVTNIIIFDLKKPLTAVDFISKLKDHGVLAVPFGPHSVRFVTHLDFTEDMLKQTLDVLERIY